MMCLLLIGFCWVEKSGSLMILIVVICVCLVLMCCLLICVGVYCNCIRVLGIRKCFIVFRWILLMICGLLGSCLLFISMRVIIIILVGILGWCCGVWCSFLKICCSGKGVLV